MLLAGHLSQNFELRLPFIAYSLVLFFSLTRYTFPTSPFPMSLILSKLLGPTSTLRTLMLLLLYVLLNAILLRSFPGVTGPLIPGTGSKSPLVGTVSIMLKALALLCWPTLDGGVASCSAVSGLLSPLPLPLPLLILNRPCALGALATLLNFLASSSFPFKP